MALKTRALLCKLIVNILQAEEVNVTIRAINNKLLNARLKAYCPQKKHDLHKPK